MKVEISKVKISDRIRTDAGNLDELANDIKENGLITPIAVTEDMELLAGWRRLHACKQLGMTEIEANVMSPKDALAKLKIEISENENRKPFTFSEKMRWAEVLKKAYQKVAEENSKANLKNSGVSSVQNCTVGRVNEKVANEVGLGSARTMSNAEYVIQHATPEMIKELDDGQLSVNAAYMSLKKENEKLKSANDMLEGLEEEASNKIDCLDMEAQRLREENRALKQSMMNADHVELRKEIGDTKLALRDMEEQKVSAEMTVIKQKNEIDSLKASRKSIMDAFDAYKQDYALSQKQSSNPELLQLKAMLGIVSELIGKCRLGDLGDMTDEDRGAIYETVKGISDAVIALAESFAA